MKQLVVMTAPLPDDAVRMLSQDFEVVVHDASGIRSEPELIALLSEADGAITLLSDPVTREVLGSNPHLRVVANYAVGVDNIDLVAAGELNITVCNTPGVLTEATAELTLALLFSMVRRIAEGDRFMRQGRFTGWQPLLLLGSSLGGKRLGIVGLGRIGAAVATRAAALGMNVSYVSRTEHPDVEAESGAVRVDLPELLKTSDVVSLHCPLTPQTRGLIGQEQLRLMKRGAYLINTARGPVVDEGALAAALEEGHLRGAALDVFEREPAVEPRLLRLENVVLVPHLGSATDEARSTMAKMVAVDVARVLNGGAPLHPVVAR